MPDAPLITITDPRDPREHADVLAARDERPPFRLPRKFVAAVALVALVGGGTAYGVDRHRTQVAEQRRMAAAFAKADTVHAHVALADNATVDVAPDLFGGVVVTESVNGSEVARPAAPDTGAFELLLTLTDDPGFLDGIADVRLLGAGLTPAFDIGGLSGRAPGGEPLQFPARSTFACSDIAAGRYPTYDKVEVDVVPASGKVHTVTLTPPTGTSGRKLSLQACRLPDPDATPETSMQGQRGRFLMEITGIQFSKDSVSLVSLTSPGLAFTSELGRQGFPKGVPPDSGVVFDVGVRVTDCAAARGSDFSVRAVLRSGSRTYQVTVPDAPVTSFNRTGSSLLRAKVAKACG